MGARTRPLFLDSLKGRFVGSMVILLVLTGMVFLTVSGSGASSAFKSPTTISQQALPLARVYPYLAYDEQVGVTFTQDFTSLAFNVSAVAQTGPDGVGPGYLLDGLTDAGYWYQVGLSWKWPSTNGAPLPAFSMNYEVFDQFGLSVFPTTGGGGIDTIRVNSGDLVLLNLNFSGTDVVMQATDWNTTSSATEYYPAEGASYFVGLPNSASSNGFFTGLMTEEYHSTPYNGTGQPVVYEQSGFNMSSAWVWADEFNTNTFHPVFSDGITSPIHFSNVTLLNYFSSHGTAEAVSGEEFITGLSPIEFPILRSSTLSNYHAGDRITITLNLQNPSKVPVRLSSLTISTAFGVFDVSSSLPSTLNSGNSTFTAIITIPATIASGNYTLTTLADWQFLDPQLNDWIAPDPLQANTTIPISGTATPSTPPQSTPPPSTPPPSTTTPAPSRLLTLLRTVLLPALVAYAGAVALVVALVLRRQRRQTFPAPILSQLTCKVCGNVVGQTMFFCPNCGSSLTSLSDNGNVVGSPLPPSPP